MKILILGYSKIVRKRVINVLRNEKNLKIFVATKTFKDFIPDIEKKYNSYEKAIKNCNPNLIYISLPNSKHFFWAKKSLKSKCHTIVDKPITLKYSEIRHLIALSKKNKKLLAESTFYNYHYQIKKLKKIFDKDDYKSIQANFIIPMPNKDSILLSKKFGGGVLMDMGPYISSIPRVFNLKKFLNKKILIRKNSKKIIIFIQILIKFKEGKFKGKFAFGGKYVNQLTIKNKNKKAKISRVFSPPQNENLYLNYRNKDKLINIKFKKDDCFRNFFDEVRRKLKNNQYDYYYERMLKDCQFRSKLLK